MPAARRQPSLGDASPTHHADEQQRDEAYTWGSFLRSRMYQRCVTCMDCHEPHALKLRAADARHPYDPDILSALVAMNRQAGQPRAALPYARKLAEALPDDAGVQRLLAELERAH